MRPVLGNPQGQTTFSSQSNDSSTVYRSGIGAGRQCCKGALHGLDSREIRLHLMVTAALVGDETKVPLRIVTTRPSAAKMDDRGQILLLLERCRPLSDRFRYVTVEERGGQLDRMARNDPGVEAVEPTGVEVVPRPVFDDDMVMDTIALSFLKRAVGDLKHADCRRGRLVPLEWV